MDKQILTVLCGLQCSGKSTWAKSTVEYDNRVVPVEVKSGKDYERHIALNNLLDIKDFDINEAYVFCSSNLFVKDKVVYYPIYMIAFFEQVQVEDKVFKLDLSGLK